VIKLVKIHKTHKKMHFVEILATVYLLCRYFLIITLITKLFDVKVTLVVLFSVWLRHVFVAILTSFVQCTRHTAGFGNIILLSNVELFQHVK
jgi:hypothetical protein